MPHRSIFPLWLRAQAAHRKINASYHRQQSRSVITQAIHPSIAIMKSPGTKQFILAVALSLGLIIISRNANAQTRASRQKHGPVHRGREKNCGADDLGGKNLAGARVGQPAVEWHPAPQCPAIQFQQRSRRARQSGGKGHEGVLRDGQSPRPLRWRPLSTHSWPPHTATSAASRRRIIRAT